MIINLFGKNDITFLTNLYLYIYIQYVLKSTIWQIFINKNRVK